MLAGMMRAYKLTGDRKYRQFVERFADHWHRQGIEPLLAKKGYCGHWGPGWALLELYEGTGDQRCLALVNQINDFMLNKAERTRDGGLSHFSGRPQLWVDTLAMCGPVLSDSARIMKRPELQAEAVRQLQRFADHLQDSPSGLFYHMWDEKSGKRTPAFWGRGNGWVVIAYTEALKSERPGSRTFRELAKPYRRQMARILELQDRKTGLWHTVLDEPATYLETSCSAMFLYGLAEAAHHKLLDLPAADAMRRAWIGLCSQVGDDGRVRGVSAGTGPGDSRNYQSRPIGTYTWGTGAALLAACAYAEMISGSQ